MTPASDRKPMIGDRVWLERDGQRHEGVVSDAGGSAGAAAIAANAVGYFSSIGKRLGLYPHAFGNTWGFLDDPAPIPEAPKPYGPMVGDTIALPTAIVTEVSRLPSLSVTLSFEGREMAFNRAWIESAATLVSRPEKPLSVGEKVTYRVDARAAGEVRSICGDFAWVQWLPGDAPVTVAVADLRRAPEGE